MKIKDSVIRITDAFKKYKNTIFNKNNYNLEKFVCIITLVLSILIVSIGFTSTIFTYYIGDTLLRIFLLFLGLLLIYQIVYSYKKLKQRGKIITMSIFTIIVLILASVIYRKQVQDIKSLKSTKEEETNKNIVLTDIGKLEERMDAYKRLLKDKDAESVISNISDMAKESGVKILSIRTAFITQTMVVI